jgi:hypothetical protein
MVSGVQADSLPTPYTATDAREPGTRNRGLGTATGVTRHDHDDRTTKLTASERLDLAMLVDVETRDLIEMAGEALGRLLVDELGKALNTAREANRQFDAAMTHEGVTDVQLGPP